MNSDERLAEVYEAIAASGIQALVMGGHAVRFYGVERNTIDYDLHLLYPEWDGLPERLRKIFASRGESLAEAPSWRPRAFRRFVLGRLPDGREERLECWRENHLLPPFPELFARRSEGLYGRRMVAFLGLKDLIRSKETEREDDWRDIELLEEILDDRPAAKTMDAEGRIAFLSQMRSRRGFAAAVKAGLLEDPSCLAAAWSRARNPITRAFLSPYVLRESGAALPVGSMIDEIVEVRLRRVEPASSRHLALVEAVRRLYKREAMEADRKDKLASL